MNIIMQRAKAPTPRFFTKLRNLSAAMVAIAATILAAPVSLPAAITTAAAYVLTAGSVAGMVSQLTVKNSRNLRRKNPKKGGPDADSPQP